MNPKFAQRGNSEFNISYKIFFSPTLPNGLKHLSKMVAKALLTSISLALSLVGAVSGIKSSGTNSSDIVTWDKYSLKINNERLFTFSGEFHVSSSFSGKY